MICIFDSIESTKALKTMYNHISTHGYTDFNIIANVMCSVTLCLFSTVCRLSLKEMCLGCFPFFSMALQEVLNTFGIMETLCCGALFYVHQEMALLHPAVLFKCFIISTRYFI